MRKQDRIIIWPAYFDSTKTRKEGRRIKKSLAVPSPRIAEIRETVQKLGLNHELVENAGYSKTPWVKTGMLLVKKNQTKEETIRRIAEQLLKMRSAVATK